MQRYTLEQLSAAGTYTNDPALATLARRVAESCTDVDLPMGERKRLALSGGLAAAVLAAVEKVCAAEDVQLSTQRANRAALECLEIPGWRISLDGDYAVLAGPIDDTVNAALRRHGEWLAAQGVWRVPVSKGLTLVRSLKRQAGPAAAQARQDKSVALRRSQIERWLGYVESAAAEGRVYQRGVDECQKQGVGDFREFADRLDSALQQARAGAARMAAARESERAALRAQWNQERAQRQTASAKRVLWPISMAPHIGRPYRLKGCVVVYTGAGRQFRVSEDDPSTLGSHLLGHEGEPCTYYYYREATDAERATLG